MKCPQCGAGVGQHHEQTATMPVTLRSVCMVWCGWSTARVPLTADDLAELDRKTQQEAVNAERGRAARRKKKATDGWSEELLKRARR